MSEHSCETCEMRDPRHCGHLCQPPTDASSPGVDAWQPIHYSSFRKWDGRAWVYDREYPVREEAE